MTPPRDPVAAVTHPDPYPYYASLVAERPLHRDDVLGLWVASSADTVTAVLTNERCRVRPTAEPVPRALVGTAAGEIFRHLIRMNDGAAHAPMKRAVSATLEELDIAHVAATSRERARGLVDEMTPHVEPARLTDFAFRLTAEVTAALLGAPPDALPSIARWTDDVVRSLAPGAAPDAIQRGTTAAEHLRDAARAWNASDGLGAALHERALGDRDIPGDGAARSDAIAANAIGFLSQSYEATAGLIGNTLLAIAREPDLRRAVPAVVLEVLRHDPPVQNTRRFVASDGDVAGVPMKTGDAILVVLAAANRDPAVNPDPADFDVTRAAPALFTFGVGVHACPGAMLATTIAAAGVQQLIAAGVPLDELTARVSYRPAVNTRIPLFGAAR